MIYAGILAGGQGTRMGNVPMPKQFLKLNEKPIIIHTIEKFLLNNEITEIIIASPKEWLNYTNDTLRNFNINLPHVKVVAGGNDRNDSIMSIVHYIEREKGIYKDDLLITHDAVRPFLTHRIIQDNIDMGLQYGAVDTVIRAVDTIVESTDDEFIKDIPKRAHMYQGQTPQTFNVQKLQKLYSDLTSEEREILTDACKIFSMKGEPVKLVEGEIFNLKITTPFDLNVAHAIMKGRLDK